LDEGGKDELQVDLFLDKAEKDELQVDFFLDKEEKDQLQVNLFWRSDPSRHRGCVPMPGMASRLASRISPFPSGSL
jgi:hypothetical protein